MTAPDRRVAFREGAFDARSAFYPRAGCDPPPPGFSVLAAGGFTAEAALAALLGGGLPQEDPATCAVSAPAETTIVIAARAPADVQAVGCAERRNDSSVRYRAPPPNALDFAGRVWACAHLPTFDTGGAGGGGPARMLHPARHLGAHLRPLQGPDALHAARVLRGRQLRGPRMGLHGQPARLVAMRAVRPRERTTQTRRTTAAVLLLALAAPAPAVAQHERPPAPEPATGARDSARVTPARRPGRAPRQGRQGRRGSATLVADRPRAIGTPGCAAVSD